MKTFKIVILVVWASLMIGSFSFAADVAPQSKLNKEIVAAFFEAKDYEGLDQYLDRFPCDPRANFIKQLTDLMIRPPENSNSNLNVIEMIEMSPGTPEIGEQDKTKLAEMGAMIKDAFGLIHEAEGEVKKICEKIGIPIEE